MYPKPLSDRVQEWIAWILPVDRAGYRQYREVIHSMVIIGEGRRGKGEMILGRAGASVDFSAPLAPVFAYGAIETNFGTISITLREMMDEQISVEIVSQRAEEVPEEFEESRRWTYSTWKPGDVCPQCGKVAREVSMQSVATLQEHFVLVLCSQDRRLWVYDVSSQVNRLIPTTNYYNELMLHKNIREPKTALDPKRLFTALSSFSDSELTYAFFTYNKLKTKVHLVGGMLATETKKHSWLGKFMQMFSK